MMGGGEKRLEASDAPLEETLLLPPLLESAVAARSADENRGGGGRTSRKWEKTYLDVLAMCCSAEVALVEQLLAPLDGVRAVSVVVPSRTVVVEHDPTTVSQSHREGSEQGRPRSLGANLRQQRDQQQVAQSVHRLQRRPPPRVFLPVASPPLQWLALEAACAGAPLMLLRGFAVASRLTLDINILMLIAVAGAVALNDYMEAGVIVFFFTTVEWVETLACSKASAGMSSLMSMIPPKVVVVETGEVVNVREAA